MNQNVVYMKLIIVAALLAMIVAPALAGDPWVVVSGGVTSYSLGGLTDSNTTYRGYELESGSMEGGARYSAALGFDFGRKWALGLEYDRNWASVSGSSETNHVYADMPLYSVKLTSTLYAIDHGSLRAGIGTGLGVGYVLGTVRTDSGWYGGLEGDIEAAGAQLEGMFVAEYSPVRKLAIQGRVGYRSVAPNNYVALPHH